MNGPALAAVLPHPRCSPRVTWLWLALLLAAGLPGCSGLAPTCHSDADCAPSAYCNPATLVCFGRSGGSAIPVLRTVTIGPGVGQITVRGSAVPLATVRIFLDADCSGTPAGTGSSDASGAFSVQATAPAQGTAYGTAESADVGSLCSPGKPYPSTITSVSVAPSQISVLPNVEVQLTATVSGEGTFGTDVTWSVTPPGPTLAPSGTVLRFGSSATGTFTVTATSQDDPTKSGSATVQVGSGLVVNITAPATSPAYARAGLPVAVSVAGLTPDRIDFYSDARFIGTVTPPTLGFTWDTTTEAEGSHALVAKAFVGTTEFDSLPVTVVVDRTPPTVASVTPVTSGTGCPLWSAGATDADATYLVRFSEPVAGGTVGASSVSLSSGGSAVPSTVSVVDATTVQVTPTSLPARPCTLSVDVASAVTDLAGNPAVAASTSFTLPFWIQVGPPFFNGANFTPVLALDANDLPWVGIAVNSSLAPSRVLVTRWTPSTGWSQVGLDFPLRAVLGTIELAFVPGAGGGVVLAYDDRASQNPPYNPPVYIHASRWDGAGWVPAVTTDGLLTLDPQGIAATGGFLSINTGTTLGGTSSLSGSGSSACIEVQRPTGTSCLTPSTSLYVLSNSLYGADYADGDYVSMLGSIIGGSGTEQHSYLYRFSTGQYIPVFSYTSGTSNLPYGETRVFTVSTTQGTSAYVVQSSYDGVRVAGCPEQAGPMSCGQIGSISSGASMDALGPLFVVLADGSGARAYVHDSGPLTCRNPANAPPTVFCPVQLGPTVNPLGKGASGVRVRQDSRGRAWLSFSVYNGDVPVKPTSFFGYVYRQN